MLLSPPSYVQLPLSTVKPPRHAAYDATLAKRRADRWAGAYRYREEEEEEEEEEEKVSTQISLYIYIYIYI